jgi:hypothetical protein
MNDQLTFENLRTNRTVPAADCDRLKKQAVAIYNRLVAGPAWTFELLRIACQYNARIKELRDWLAGFGMTIDCIEHEQSGNNLYKITALHGSNYQRLLMEKQGKKRN